MEVVFSQQDCAAAMGLVSRLIKGRPFQPVLAQAQIETADDGIIITASNLTVWLRAKLDARVVRPGRLLLPIELLSQMAKAAPPGELSLTSNSSSSCRLQWNGGWCDLVAGEGEFPIPPDPGSGDLIVCSASRWAEAVKRVEFAASDDQAKVVLTGIHVRSGNGGGIELAATNAHRLAICCVMTNEEERQPNPGGFTVPAQVLADLAPLCTKETATIELLVTHAWVKIGVGRYQVIVRLLEGRYPDYDRIVPTQFATEVTLDRAALVEALERIGVVADKNNKTTQFAFADNQLQITALASGFATGAERLPAMQSGPNLIISFNYRYLLDGLKQMRTSQVRGSFARAHDPALWIPIGDPDFRYLVMPVQTKR